MTLGFSQLLCEIEGIVHEGLTPVVNGTRRALQADANGEPFVAVDVEAAVEGVLVRIGAAVVDNLSAQVDAGRVRNQHACSCGGAYSLVKKRRRWLGFIFGAVHVNRAYFRCKRCGQTRVPLEHVWGLQQGVYAMGRRLLTPRAQEVLGTLCAALPYQEARRHFNRLTALVVGPMMGWRVIQRLGAQLRQRVTGAQGEVPAAKGAVGGKGRGILRWFIGADGVMVAFWKWGDRRRRDGDEQGTTGDDKPRRRLVWMEVRVGMVGLLDMAGKIVRGSQWYVVSRMPVGKFRTLMRRVAQARGVRQIDVVAVVSDAANWIIALWSRHFPWGTRICDFYHAREHLTKAAIALYGENSPQVERWAKRMARRLKRGEVSILLGDWASITHKPVDAEAWRREVNYFRNHQDAMAYNRYQAENLPIGSGPVEGACKSTVGSRFKRPGARWSEEGFYNLAPIRARYCSGVPIMP